MTEQDRQHVRLLSLFHYAVGTFVGVFACFPAVPLAVGIASLTGAFGHPSDHGALRVGVFTIVVLSSLDVWAAFDPAIGTSS